MGGTRQFVGGVSGPTRSGGRAHATWPLAILSIGPGHLSVAGRGPLRRIFAESVVNPVHVAVEAIRGPIMNGIVMTFAKDEKWLFWTWSQPEVLAALREFGAQVSGESRRLKWWSDTMGY